jgi:hypothetical protein
MQIVKMSNHLSVLDGPYGIQRTMKAFWFSLTLDDEATFRQLLANSALHLDSLRNGGREPRETSISLNFQTMAVNLIRRKLTEESMVTNSMLSAVTALIGYDVCCKKLLDLIILKISNSGSCWIL